MTDFPMDIVIFKKIVEVFSQTRSYVLLLFPLAFFLRITFGFIVLKVDSFTDILKDSLFLFLGLFFFTDILKLSLQIPYFISNELTLGEWTNINMGEGIFSKALKRVVDWIGILSYWISFGLYVVIVSILGFFAGYILFVGTMFRAYGLLKIFFILLFTVSLWPLLWHSINFAVYTIAVSDNAMANNVIVGGSSLAKVFIPLWLISKTSKIPVSQTLQKISFFGGNLAYAGGNYASSFLNNNKHTSSQNIQNKEDVITNEEAQINVLENSYSDEAIGDFSIRNQEIALNQEQSIGANSQNHFQESVLQENQLQNETKKEFENNPQITTEIEKSQALNHNESILNKTHSQSLDYKETNNEQKMFSKTIHEKDWINEGEKIHRPPQKEKNKRDD